MKRLALLLTVVALSQLVQAQDLRAQDSFQHMMHMGKATDTDMNHDMGHAMTQDEAAAPVTEGGQAAFVAIQEIVARLMADPDTDWSRVDIEALRQHLIDMDNVTLRANVAVEEIEGGARFVATSDVPRVVESIRAMVLAHVATMNGVEGWTMRSEIVDGGAALTVTGTDPERIRALGFIGLMTVGMHHQAHHLALATGQNPHGQ
ncbi:MAG: hypothetical protein KDJ77_09775 [Rhodobiaceae bacterium]|nr:hypothetical protein [Rhodobiaceae bacterium]